MTTIAYKEGLLAADQQETWASEEGGAQKYKCIKLFRKTTAAGEPVVIALAGSTFPGLVFFDWYGSGNPAPECLTWAADDDADFDALILTRQGLFLANRFCRPVKVEDKYFAIGSGRKAAMAAMRKGSSAEDAVRVAITIDPYTSGRVTVMGLVPIVTPIKPKRRRRTPLEVGLAQSREPV